MKVSISPGHGGQDNGATYEGVEEDDINLSIAQLLYYELKLYDIDCFLLRERDEYISLKQQVDRSNNNDVDLFLSIHCDAFVDKSVSGITTFIYRYPSMNSISIGSIIDRQFKIGFSDIRSRGLKKENFYVLRKTMMPAVLIECGFLSNDNNRKFIKEPENQRKVAITIRKSILIYNNRR